jgi:hypothetical protein
MFATAPSLGAATPALAQNDIDGMFAPPQTVPVKPSDPAGTAELGQDDVDRLFG